MIHLVRGRDGIYRFALVSREKFTYDLRMHPCLIFWLQQRKVLNRVVVFSTHN